MSTRYTSPAPAAWHRCCSCGREVLITARAVAQGFACRTCDASSWELVMGVAMEAGRDGRRREGRA
jgi:hypothetical protein